MIDWVHQYCIGWGRAKRRILTGQDGWPSRSMLGRLIDEGAMGASQRGALGGHYPEVLEGHDLEVNIALKRMVDTHRMAFECLIIWAHYVIEGAAKSKAKRLDIKIDEYWKSLHTGHAFIAAHFPKAPRESEDRRDGAHHRRHVS